MTGGMQQTLIYAFEQIKVIINDKELNSKGPENLRRGLQIFSSANYQEFEELLAVANVQILALIDRFTSMTVEFYDYQGWLSVAIFILIGSGLIIAWFLAQNIIRRGI